MRVGLTPAHWLTSLCSLSLPPPLAIPMSLECSHFPRKMAHCTKWHLQQSGKNHNTCTTRLLLQERGRCAPGLLQSGIAAWPAVQSQQQLQCRMRWTEGCLGGARRLGLPAPRPACMSQALIAATGVWGSRRRGCCKLKLNLSALVHSCRRKDRTCRTPRGHSHVSRISTSPSSDFSLLQSVCTSCSV